MQEYQTGRSNSRVNPTFANAFDKLLKNAATLTGVPNMTRMHDLCLRRAALYPAELLALRARLVTRLDTASGAGGGTIKGAHLSLKSPPSACRSRHDQKLPISSRPKIA